MVRFTGCTSIVRPCRLMKFAPGTSLQQMAGSRTYIQHLVENNVTKIIRSTSNVVGRSRDARVFTVDFFLSWQRSWFPNFFEAGMLNKKKDDNFND